MKIIIRNVKGLCGRFKGWFGMFCGKFKSRFEAAFVGIIYATIGLESEGCYYLIGNNMVDNCCLMNGYIRMLIC